MARPFGNTVERVLVLDALSSTVKVHFKKVFHFLGASETEDASGIFNALVYRSLNEKCEKY